MRYLFTAIALVLVCCLTAVVLVYNGVILLNGFSSRGYSVRGVDVSSYQGEINWEVLAAQNIQFAFIKATEGSGHIDPFFEGNFEAALQTDLRIGAYHFFSYDSAGATQAENFIATVPRTANMLPPVVDVEFYGDKEQNPPDREAVHTELSAMLYLLEEFYGVRPILYTTEKSYRLYIADAFEEYDIWIRNVLTRPTLSDGRDWTFWQYTNRQQLEGYYGTEKFIDMNVFHGSPEEFAQYGNHRGLAVPIHNI